MQMPAQVEDVLEFFRLAIELAAARMRVLSVPQLRQRLAARFELLTSSPVGGPARHATLREAIAWSWSGSRRRSCPRLRRSRSC